VEQVEAVGRVLAVVALILMLLQALQILVAVVVVARMPMAYTVVEVMVVTDLTSIGGGLTYTKTTSGGYTIYTFTAGTGTVTV